MNTQKKNINVPKDMILLKRASLCGIMEHLKIISEEI